MMDEFDMWLHTRLADFILDLIHASESSQLLFTSHNTNLIDVKRLRRDQIVFVNKSEQGATEVYSLYDFKDFRENMDAEKGYIQGRFDAVPYVDSSVSSIKQLLEGWLWQVKENHLHPYGCERSPLSFARAKQRSAISTFWKRGISLLSELFHT